jgi:hypothetical protein
LEKTTLAFFEASIPKNLSVVVPDSWNDRPAGYWKEGEAAVGFVPSVV